MSDLTIEQLEDLKILMEPTPPFLDALIAEKRTHQKLRAKMSELAQKMRGRALPDIGDDWGDAMTEAAIMVEKFIEDTGENVENG